jgi:hypothetical protein
MRIDVAETGFSIRTSRTPMLPQGKKPPPSDL